MAEETPTRKSRGLSLSSGSTLTTKAAITKENKEPDANEVAIKEGFLGVASKGVLKSKKAQMKVVLTSTALHLYNKKSLSRKKKDSIPLSLAWLVDKVGKNQDEEDTAESFAFAIQGPEGITVLCAKSEAEKAEWVKEIRLAVLKQVKFSKEDTGIRKGKFNYTFGTYDGEWLKGKVHGRGKFITNDGTIFEGDWNAELGAGAGDITPHEKDHAKHEGGWEYDFARHTVQEVHADIFGNVDFDNGDVLTDKDYATILSGSTKVVYSKGATIKSEGAENDQLYYIKSGKIAMRKQLPGSGFKTLGVMEKGFFGEMSIFDKNVISATIVAEQETELACIQLTYLYSLFRTNAGLSKRFHQFMAYTLAKRLSNAPAQAKEGPERKLKSTLSTSFLPVDGGPSHEQFARKWVRVWNKGDPKLQVGFMTEKFIYRDPFSGGSAISTREEFQRHSQALRQKLKSWVFDSPDELFAFSNGFTFRSKVTISTHNGQSLNDICLGFALLNQKNDRIERLELFFDTSQFKKQEEDVEALKTSAMPGLPKSDKTTDIKFRERFGLSSTEAVLKEFTCTLSHKGKMYISQNHLSFYSKIYSFKTVQTIPLKTIRSCKRKQLQLVISYKAKHRKEGLLEHLDKLSFGFESKHELDDCIGYLITTCKFGSDDQKEEQATGQLGQILTDEPKILKYARCSGLLDLHLPKDKEVFGFSDEKCHRLVAPIGFHDDDTTANFGTDVTVRVTSTYPHIATKGADGNVLVVPNARQGDPICDQVCLERYENATIVALADGCNWGDKPRKAAQIASRTFVEYVKHNLSHIETVQQAGSVFLSAFSQAHRRILEGHEEQWWEVGTTTLIGGTILRLSDQDNSWAFVCASVGDCKAYHISRKGTVIDITQGSRKGSAATDASDSGGRLGPYKDGDPDLRNLSLYFHLLDEGDLILIASDGVYDNLDPQSLGKLPKEVGLQDLPWKEIKNEIVEEKKSQYACDTLRSLIFGSTDEEEEEVPDLPDTATIVNKVIEHAQRVTTKSREFMEKFPDMKQPSDYTQYPGKMDHTSCACMKVGPSSFNEFEQSLDTLINRIRHPVTGFSALAFETASQMIAGDNPKEKEKDKEKHHKVKREASSVPLVFKGASLQKWLEDNEAKGVDSFNLCQDLLNFRYILPIDVHSERSETFEPELKYQFQVYEPIMSKHAWELLLKGAEKQEYKKDAVIVREGDPAAAKIYYIESGTCRIEKHIGGDKSLDKSGEKSDDSVGSTGKRTSHPELSTSTAKKDKKRSKSPTGDKAASSATGSSSTGLLSTSVESGKTIQLNALHETETFGEVSFLFNAPASAFVIADTDVTVHVIDGKFVNLLFVKYPYIAGLFYHYLASVLARRLKRQESKFQ